MAGGIDATRMLNEAILNRHAAPQEIARSALYLASDLSSFVTCSTLMVDGGTGMVSTLGFTSST